MSAEALESAYFSRCPSFEKILNQDQGWGYGPDSDYPDLDDKEHGTMILKNSYVVQAIESCCQGAQLVRFESGVWFGH